MLHQHYTEFLKRELDFLKILVSRFHEQEQIADVELDLTLLKVQGIYEQLLKLKLIHRQLSGAESAKARPAENAAPPVQSEAGEDAPVLREAAPVAEAAEERAVESFRAEAPETEAKEAVAEEREETPAAVLPRGSRGNITLADRIKPAGYNPINETLAQKNPVNDLSSRLQTTPLESITAGIGLNDRFLYIRELFGGNGELYADTVQKLDGASSLAEAMNFVNERFRWDGETESAQKFLHLIRRRHSGNP
ncbi:MAG: hypothetical protein LBR08_11440 [Bacteroidales bacterium]|jgi:hypothetical protein|nr:hypothetical protein [Bacteroidales bacterium]